MWGEKWGTFRWGHSVPATSNAALLRAVVGGNTPWLPTPSVSAPNGGDPVTGAALYRHAVVHAYLLDDDWNQLTEFVGIVDGSRTSSLTGPLQQDTMTLTLWDPSDYYTEGAGAALVYDGNLIQIVMEIKSPGGVVTAPLGIYRLQGFPAIRTSRQGTQLTLNAVEWWRPFLGYPYVGGSCPEPEPNWLPFSSGVQDSSFGAASWPTTTFSLLESLYSIINCDPDFVIWAATEFTNQREQDFDDGLGPQPIWLAAPYTLAAAAFWKMLNLNLHPERLVIDRNVKNPFGGFFNGLPAQTTSLGAETMIRNPEWREMLGQLVSTSPYMAVLGGDGKIHIRNPGARYVTPFVISCDASDGGVIPLPMEDISRTPNQPEFTEVSTYTQVNPLSDSTGKVINNGYYGLRSTAKAPSRYQSGGVRREVVVWDTYIPSSGRPFPGPLVTTDGSSLPWIDDGTAIPRMLEIMAAADSISITTDSAFPYIKLGDEIRVSRPGIRGYFTVNNISQPFNTSAMTIGASWRSD